jgi:TolA-binding protein
MLPDLAAEFGQERMGTMSSKPRGMKAVLIGAALVSAGAMTLAGVAPATAQSQTAETTDQKVRRHDGEIKALQRKVFPEGAGKFFTPEITPATPDAAAPTGTPASGPLTDLLARMDSLEGQVTRLTGQLEESQNRIAKLEAQVAALTPPAPVVAAADPVLAPAPATGATIAATTAVMSGTATPKPAPKPAPTPAPAPAASAPAPKTAPPADRVAAVQAIVKPQSTDAGEDDYSYGFRLWEAKFYPEAQQQLLRYLELYPRHRRGSYARNLLGRAYLDDGKPGTAAQYFVQNYQNDPNGDRAPDSLLYLAVSMTRLKETKRACVALQELGEKYPAVAAGRLAGDLARARAGVKCN